MDRLIKHLFLVLLLAITFAACNEDGENDTCTAFQDEVTLFHNMADERIIPGYTQFLGSLNDLEEAIGDFLLDLSEANLTIAQEKFKNAYLDWQVVAPFEFGPAETLFLRNSINNFPINLEEMEELMNAEIRNFEQPDRFDKGFPALDYLLFGSGASQSEIVAFFTGTEGEKNRSFLHSVVINMILKTSGVLTKWEDEYRASFVVNQGTAAGGSLSLLLNNLNQHYEIIKRDAIGIPSGILTLGFPNPETVEGYYSRMSVELAATALESNYDLFMGNDLSGNNGLGFDDILIEIDARKEDGSLAELIKGNYENAITQVQSLASPLSITVSEDQASVENTYRSISQQLVNIKTDLPSILCISITYIDNPSDSD